MTPKPEGDGDENSVALICLLSLVGTVARASCGKVKLVWPQRETFLSTVPLIGSERTRLHRFTETGTLSVRGTAENSLRRSSAVPSWSFVKLRPRLANVSLTEVLSGPTST